MSVIQEIVAERCRQMSAEGWSSAHDDKYKQNEIGLAAACYAATDENPEDRAPSSLTVRMWPWDWKFWKPTTHRRNLIKAAALIVAEIERLDRAEPPTTPATEKEK